MTASVASLQASAVHRMASSTAGGVHGMQPVVGWQVSAPLQNSPSAQRELFGVATHEPLPLQVFSVQGSPSSVHGVPEASKQESVGSWQASAHSGPAAHGLPACVQ